MAVHGQLARGFLCCGRRIDACRPARTERDFVELPACADAENRRARLHGGGDTGCPRAANRRAGGLRAHRRAVRVHRPAADGGGDATGFRAVGRRGASGAGVRGNRRASGASLPCGWCFSRRGTTRRARRLRISIRGIGGASASRSALRGTHGSARGWRCLRCRWTARTTAARENSGRSG